MSTALATLTNKLASRLDMGNDGRELIETLKSTAFKGGTQVTDAQMTALMVVANQYGLNPWTKEIFAFPDKGGIVPVVGVDGWSRIINNHAQFDGIEFEQDGESCTCTIYRKDRNHPTRVTEYMAECRRTNAGPWASHPRRMLRHKAMIQCARIAFGYVGIYDQDEAERIMDGHERPMGPAEVVSNGDAPATRSDAIKARLTSRKALIETGPSLETVLTLIADAGSREELAGAVDMAKKLSKDDQLQARDAYKARVAAMQAEDDAEAQAERKAIQDAA